MEEMCPKQVAHFLLVSSNVFGDICNRIDFHIHITDMGNVLLTQVV